MGARHVRPEARERSQRTIDRERLGLALHGHGLELLVLEDALRLPERVLRARDSVHRRLTLQARGGVHDVSCDDPLTLFGPRAEGDYRLTGGDANTNLE